MKAQRTISSCTGDAILAVLPPTVRARRRLRSERDAVHDRSVDQLRSRGWRGTPNATDEVVLPSFGAPPGAPLERHGWTA
jgi:hypothetical protein